MPDANGRTSTTAPSLVAKRQDRRGRKVSPASLMNAALFYLQRFSASRARVRTVLARKVSRSVKEHDSDPEEGARWVEEVLDTLERKGFLNDVAYAESRARALATRGTAMKAIRLKLKQGGVDEETARAALDRLETETGHAIASGEADFAAAVAYARRRRLGPWRIEPTRSERRDRDIAALARQGFSFDIALRVVDAPTPDVLESEVTALPPP